MKPSKFEELHTRESAGAGYDISASRSEANAQAANQQAGTVINFGSGSVTDKYGDQSAAPNATAVAARTAGNTDTSASLPDGTLWHEKIDWPMVAIAFVIVAAIGGAVYYHRKQA